MSHQVQEPASFAYRDIDELPHTNQMGEGWSENYFSYLYDPDAEVGVWLHFRYHGGLWEQMLVIYLPDQKYLVAKSSARGTLWREEAEGRGQLSSCGLSFRCENAFARWTKQFRGDARLIRAADLDRGAVDGPHVYVDLELDCEMMSPPIDYGRGSLDQAWGVSHYDQHQKVTGSLTYGAKRIALRGAGMRDHSWGPRDFARMGGHTWVNAQFPQSGRSLCIVLIGALAPWHPEPLLYGVVSDGLRITPVDVQALPIATTHAEAIEDYRVQFLLPDGTTSTIRATTVAEIAMAFWPGSEITVGSPAIGATHHYVPAFNRFTWDGEVGYGYTERSFRCSHHAGSDAPTSLA